MNPLKKLTITAAAAIPAVAMFAGVASAAVEDHVVNGGFNINTKGWSVDAGGSLKKHDGFPMAVLTNENITLAETTVRATQCVAIEPGIPANFSGRAFIPNNQERKGQATFHIGLYDDANCQDHVMSAALLPLTDTGVWKDFSYTPQPWPGETPGYAKITMVVEKAKAGMLKKGEPFMTFFDDIKLTQDIPDPVAEDDCLCAPAADDGTGEPEAPSEPAAEDDSPIPAEPAGSDDDDAPAEPEAPAEPAEEPAAEDPAEDGDEPSQPVEEPAEEESSEDAPAAGGQQGSDDPAPAAPSNGSVDGDGDDASDQDDSSTEAETSDQYELEADDAAQRELGRGQAETPAAPNTGFSVAGTKDMVGADELGIFGGVLAFFGLTLAAIAIKRERSNS